LPRKSRDLASRYTASTWISDAKTIPSGSSRNSPALGPKIDFLVNNAGVGDHGLFEESDWSRVQAMIEVNIRALTQVTHAVLSDLILSGQGAILNVSSIASLLPLPQMAVYAATKAYVTSFSEALRAELRGSGISVTALCPGQSTRSSSSLLNVRARTHPRRHPNPSKYRRSKWSLRDWLPWKAIGRELSLGGSSSSR
jgi:short-subunit dehydrogenase